MQLMTLTMSTNQLNLMNVFNRITIAILFTFVLLFSCLINRQHNIQLPEEGKFFDQLSEYGLFFHESGQIKPNIKLKMYQVTNALFTDYARKDRFIYIPDNKSATLLNNGFFEYPTGSILVKNFYYDEK